MSALLTSAQRAAIAFVRARGGGAHRLPSAVGLVPAIRERAITAPPAPVP